MAKSLEEIVALKDELKERDSDRDNSYDETIRLVLGATYKDRKKKGYSPGVSAEDLFTPKAGDDLELTSPINLVKPAISNKIAFLALPPTARVVEPPESLAPGAQPQAAPDPAGGSMTPEMADPSEWSIDFADRLEQVIQSLCAFSNFPARCYDTAWNQQVFGGAVIGVWPDLRHAKPRIFVRSPQYFYPVAYDPDGLELDKAVWVDELTGRDIEARWGLTDWVGEQDIKVATCMERDFLYTVIDDKVWAHEPIENLMDEVPIVCVKNIGVPGTVFGDTDIKDAIPVAQQINYQMALINDMAKAMVNPTIFVKDPLNVPADLAIGQGGVATAGPNGGVELLGPLNLPNAFWQLTDTLQNWFDLISDNPAVLRSEGAGSIVTGKGFNALTSPITARMQTRLNLTNAAWAQVFRYMLRMWWKFPKMNAKPLQVGGVQGKSSYYIEAKPDEFVLEGNMWTELEVNLDAQSFIDKQGDAVLDMQLYQNELISWDDVADNNPRITNKKRTRVKIDRDRKWKAEGMAMAQQMANSPATANPEMGQQERTNYGLERGAMGEVGPPPAPTGEMSAPPQASGESVSTVLADFFSSIPKLKGRVWFGGDPLLNPDGITIDGEWKATVWVEDPQDKGTITRAAEKVPEIYGHIEFIDGQPSPDEPSQIVNEGVSPSPAAGNTPPDTSGSPPAAPTPDMTGAP